MTSPINTKILNTEPSSIRVVFEEVLRLQNAGKTIIRLDIGSPNFEAPEFILKSAAENLLCGMYRYSSNWGRESLRSALARKYNGRGNIEFDASNEVIITNGASEAVAMIICTLLNSDEQFLIPTPTWPHYIADCQIFGKAYKEIETDLAEGFKLTPEKLLQAIDCNSRALILNSPGNPTGSVYSKAEFQALYDICTQNNILVILDEIYEDINFDFTGSLLSTDVDKDNLIYINGFSKNYAMTGFRIGFLMARADIAVQLIKYHQYTTVCGQAFAQQACADMIENQSLVSQYHDYVLGTLRGSQQVLAEYCENSAIQMTSPSGAFYAFAKIPTSFPDAQTFCMQLLTEKSVSIVPGNAFGDSYGQFFRISYGSVGPKDLRTALEMMSQYYES